MKYYNALQQDVLDSKGQLHHKWFFDYIAFKIRKCMPVTDEQMISYNHTIEMFKDTNLLS